MNPPRGSIGLRLALGGFVLVLLVQAASFVATHQRLGERAREALPEQLAVGERVLQSRLDQGAQQLIDKARWLVAEASLRPVTGNTPNTEAIATRLAAAATRQGVTELAWLNADFSVRSSQGLGAREVSALVTPLALRLSGRDSARAMAVVAGAPHQMALVAFNSPAPGWLLVGTPITPPWVNDVAAASTVGVTLLVRPAADPRWSVALSSLPRDVAQGLAGQRWPARGAEPGEMRSVALSAHPPSLGVQARWLTPGVDAGEAALLAIVSVPLDDASHWPPGLTTEWLGIALLGGFAAWAWGAYATRRVSTPLRQLTEAVHQLAAGDKAHPVPGQERKDELGTLARAFETLRVATAQQQAQTRQLAYWDGPTGLPNRVQFRDAVREATRGEGGCVAVIMLDLDRFKHINDVLGGRVGDLLLAQVAQRLSQQMVRDGDMVARLGGDEFAVLLRSGDEALAEAVAHRIAQAFDEPLLVDDHAIDMGVGIGIACWPQHADDAASLLNRAEVALFAAKRRAQGPLMYHAAIDASSGQALALLTELQRAVDGHELRLYLQPKLMLATGRVGGAETLVRWQHPQRGLVHPADFIPLAEQTGFIRTLTIWVFEEAARHWQTLHAHGIPMVLSVNLSSRDLLDLGLPRKFDALLVKHRVPAEAFCLEITESAIMDDPQRAFTTLTRLSALGFRLAIDNFGTGYSSLAGLKQLPVDELKIDKSFVMRMEKDRDAADIVRSSIELAHNLGLAAVAEGVETPRVWERLLALDCDAAQGYYMGRPMPASDFFAWTLAWSTRTRPAPKPGASPVVH